VNIHSGKFAVAYVVALAVSIGLGLLLGRYPVYFGIGGLALACILFPGFALALLLGTFGMGFWGAWTAAVLLQLGYVYFILRWWFRSRAK
jgi:hypothetical protein